MSTYTPDRWIIVKIQSVGKEPYYRVLAGWYGGFIHGDSWKLSSGIEKTIDRGTHYEMLQSSGSTYLCPKGSHGCSAYMASIYQGFAEDCEKNGMIFAEVDEKFIPLLEAGGPQPLPPKPKQKKPRKLTKKELKELDF
jgi:hypothetical protein